MSKPSSILDSIKKKHGELVYINKDTDFKSIQRISTGSFNLDRVLRGGFPKGRIIEIYGPNSTCKTTMCLQTVRELQKQSDEVKAAYIDAEHSLNLEYAENLGVDLDRMYVFKPDYGEQAFDIAEALIDSGEVELIVIDSVAALTPKSELEGDFGDSNMGKHARLMSQACRKLTSKISKKGTTLLFVNQIREKIGVMFGNPETTTGGNALAFYTSVRIELRGSSALKNGTEQYGTKIRAKVSKSKVSPPAEKVEFDLIFGYGIDYEGEVADAAVEMNIVERKGSWFSYNGSNVAQGRDNLVQYLKDNEDVLSEILDKIDEHTANKMAQQ